jgi:hypothetical protein
MWRNGAGRTSKKLRASSFYFWEAQAASLLSSAACRRFPRYTNSWLWSVKGTFRQAAEKDRLAACAPQIDIRAFPRIRLFSIDVGQAL